MSGKVMFMHEEKERAILDYLNGNTSMTNYVYPQEPFRTGPQSIRDMEFLVF